MDQGWSRPGESAQVELGHQRQEVCLVHADLEQGDFEVEWLHCAREEVGELDGDFQGHASMDLDVLGIIVHVVDRDAQTLEHGKYLECRDGRVE